MGLKDENFGGNAYLRIAEIAIQRAQRPLNPHQMLDLARRDGFLPKHLHGATMHRTLSARLSEVIRTQSSASPFFRTAPSTFYMHSLAERPNTPEEFRRVYVGNLRTKVVRKENVLVAPRDILQGAIYGEFTEFDEPSFQILFDHHCRFMDRRQAESDDSVKQFVTFTLVVSGTKLLIYRRGKFSSTSDELKGQLSVGFGGHVNDDDFTLFHQGSAAFKANAARELREELFFDEVYESYDETLNRAHVVGYVNVDDNVDARHHIAVLMAFSHKSDELPKKGELSINQLHWIDLSKPINDLSEFDLWSGMIIRNIMQDAKLRAKIIN